MKTISCHFAHKCATRQTTLQPFKLLKTLAFKVPAARLQGLVASNAADGGVAQAIHLPGAVDRKPQVKNQKHRHAVCVLRFVRNFLKLQKSS